MAHGARRMGIELSDDGAAEIASRARGTPRVAGRLLRRVRDFAEAEGAAAIDRPVAARALAGLEVDEVGLDSLDRAYLRALIETYGGGPVGVLRSLVRDGARVESGHRVGEPSFVDGEIGES